MLLARFAFPAGIRGILRRFLRLGADLPAAPIRRASAQPLKASQPAPGGGHSWRTVRSRSGGRTVTTALPLSRLKRTTPTTRFTIAGRTTGMGILCGSTGSMTTPLSFQTLRNVVLGVTIGILATAGTGCHHLTGLYNATLIRAQEHHDLARIRQDTREELAVQREEARRLAAERDVQAARIAAERERLEMEFCRANQEALQMRVKSNIREELESKVAFNVVHGLEVGELEVDTEKLQELLKERERLPVQAPPLPVKRPCSCCDVPCGCEPGLLRRHCPRCCRKPCQAEQKCGGPEALTQVEQLPLRKPLRPAEIPLKLPVYLSFGMEQPAMEAARVRRQPLIEQPLRQPCPYPCDDPAGRCPIPCTDALQPGPMPPRAVQSETIPVPVPDPLEEARRRPLLPFLRPPETADTVEVPASFRELGS